MYPVRDNFKSTVEKWKKKFKCTNKESYSIWGDYNSEKAQQLMINFYRCNPDDHDPGFCKSDDEFNDWLVGKYIVLLYNQIRFESD